jgi:hypothetical protein
LQRRAGSHTRPLAFPEGYSKIFVRGIVSPGDSGAVADVDDPMAKGQRRSETRKGLAREVE